MGKMLISDLDDTVMEGLRQRAAASGVSIEEEARRALAAAAEPDRVAAAQRLAEVRQLIGRLQGRSTLDYLRADRPRNTR